MKGNFHVRFLEEGEGAISPSYSAMTQIHTDGKIRENPFDLCHPCSLTGGVFYPARRGLAAGGAAPVEAREGEGAGDWGEGGAGFQHE